MFFNHEDGHESGPDDDVQVGLYDELDGDDLDGPELDGAELDGPGFG